MEFMREGGFGMWLTLAFFVAGLAAAVLRRDRGGDKIAFGSAVAVLASGLLGMSTGVYATAGYLTRVAAADRADVLAIGIRESSNNTLLAAGLGLALAIVGLVLAPRAARLATA